MSVPLSLHRFHLELTRVQHADIEMIRQGRNQDSVRLQHLYQQEITHEEQEAWFSKINAPEHYYFTIGSRGRKVGLVYVANFTPGLATSTCGVFVWDKEALGSRIPLLAILALLDFFFADLRGIFTESVVLRTNETALKLNRFFGFIIHDEGSDPYVRVHMDLERYLAQRERLLRFAYRAVKNEEARPLRLYGTPSPLNFEEINRALERWALPSLLSTQGPTLQAAPPSAIPASTSPSPS